MDLKYKIPEDAFKLASSVFKESFASLYDGQGSDNQRTAALLIHNGRLLLLMEIKIVGKGQSFPYHINEELFEKEFKERPLNKIELSSNYDYGSDTINVVKNLYPTVYHNHRDEIFDFIAWAGFIFATLVKEGSFKTQLKDDASKPLHTL